MADKFKNLFVFQKPQHQGIEVQRSATTQTNNIYIIT